MGDCHEHKVPDPLVEAMITNGGCVALTSERVTRRNETVENIEEEPRFQKAMSNPQPLQNFVVVAEI